MALLTVATCQFPVSARITSNRDRILRQLRTAVDHVWISGPNSSAPQSCWPAFFVRADGITTGRLRRNVAGVLISTVDTAEALYHSTADWQDRALSGVYHSGELCADPRSADRHSW